MGPKKSGRDGSPGGKGATDPGHVAQAWKAAETKEISRRSPQGEITCWPGIRPQQGGQKIDFGRPRAHPRQHQQHLARCLVLQTGHGLQKARLLPQDSGDAMEMPGFCLGQAEAQEVILAAG